MAEGRGEDWPGPPDCLPGGGCQWEEGRGAAGTRQSRTPEAADRWGNVRVITLNNSWSSGQDVIGSSSVRGF